MTGRHKEFTEEFRREAVRLSYSSGRTIREVAGDLGVGLSSLTRWRREQSGRDNNPAPTQSDPDKELIRLRRENEVLRQERDLLKKATAFFAAETKR